MIADELVALLGFKLTGERNLKKFNDGMDGAEKGAKRTSARMGMLVRAAGGASAAIAVAGIASVKSFAEVDRRLNRLGVTVGASKKEMDGFSSDLQRFADRYAMSMGDVTTGAETLAAAGYSLKDIVTVLPGMLATAQASGSSVEDTINSVTKASSALKIAIKDLSLAQDTMVAGGKAGQFELKAMSQYLPALAGTFASAGYTGLPGLQDSIARLQTLREDAGSDSQAATWAEAVFGKMNSGEVANSFKKMGTDIEKEMKAGAAAGLRPHEAFLGAVAKTIKGDMTKLAKLFPDQEMRGGVTSLLTSQDRIAKFRADVSGPEVAGMTLRDLAVITADTSASLQRLSNSFDNASTALGAAIAPWATPVLDSVTNDVSETAAQRKALEARGVTGWWNQQAYALASSADHMAMLGREGGFVPAGDNAAADAAKVTPRAYEALGRRPSRPVSVTPASAAPIGGANGREALAGIMARIESMDPANAVNAVNNDNRTSTVTTTISAPVTVNQTVTTPAAAPGAAASATGAAVSTAISAQAARVEQGPAW